MAIGGLNDTHFDAFKECFESALMKMLVPFHLIEEVDARMESFRKDVLNQI